MSKKRSIVLSVHRAVISDACTWSLAELISAIKDNGSANLIADRGLWEKTAVKFPQFPKTNEAVAAQFALYEEGAEKSTIKRDKGSEYNTSPISAPEASEFLNHEVAVLVSGNHLIACGLGTRHTVLIDAIGQLATRCELNFPPGCMHFATIPNKLTVEKIRNTGVRSIKFDAANLLGSLDVQSQGVVETIFGPSTDVDSIKREEMVAELSIRPKPLGRRSALEVIETPKDEWLGKAAVQVFKEDRINSYTIVLNDDTTWSEGELKLTKKVDVGRVGSTYNMAEALQEMLDYFEELRKGGHLT
ncbi:hypothetical protein [Ascidiaceihabitans sp.]|uniref:hypothetical protein n=1 Tax=Ascidiaceihabitans sp. TaxID=1872644 RepID=UPI003296AFF7